MTLQEYLKNNYKSSSIKDYARKIHQFTQFIQNPKMASLKEILVYFRYLRSKNLHSKSLKNHLQAIKIYYNFLQETHQITENPLKKFYLQDKIDKKIKFETLYSKEKIEEFYAKQTDKKAKIVVSLLMNQALTTSELIGLKINDLNLAKAELKVEKRILPLQANQILVLHDYIIENQLNSDDFLIKIAKTNINKLINKNRKTDKLQALKIRQSVIANLLKFNDLRLVQVFSGHKHSTSTENYKQTELEKLQSAVNQYHPIR